MSNGFCTTISKLIMNHSVSRHIQPCPIKFSPIQSQLHHYVRTGLYFSTCLIGIFCKTFETVSNLLPRTLLKCACALWGQSTGGALPAGSSRGEHGQIVCFAQAPLCTLFCESLCTFNAWVESLVGLVSLCTHHRCAYQHPGFQRPKRKLSM